MSRRPDPTRAAQNQQTIKNLLKLEPNKTCADCKRNKHPRWASWNLGIFICIRCSGIHRGMGTHISRVKSVDLDAWTDEQLQSVLKWGNARANKYWEAKLTPGHVPSESKIENFIRTKYESKRWVMDGPMPDPASLGSDDDVPLAVVQEKAKLERSASQRTPVSSQPPVSRQPQQSIDFFGDDNTISPPARPSTTDPPAVARPPPSNAQPAAKPGKPAESLLGLDFFGTSQSTPTSRPGSTGPASGSQAGVSRPDLKQSILSLYATAPKPQPAQHERTSSIGVSNQSNVGSLTDAFSGLTFPTTPASPPAPKPQSQSSDVFAGLTGFGGPKSPPVASRVTSPSSTSGGSLFDSIASNNPAPKPDAARTASISSNGWETSFAQNVSQPKQPPPQPSASNDLFDLTAPEPPKPSFPPVAQSTTSSNLTSSVFNLSSPAAQPAQKAAPTTSTSTSNVTSVFSAAASMDPWGGNAWSTPDPAPAPAAPAATTSSFSSKRASNPADSMRMPDTLTSQDLGAGWGAPSNPTASSKTTAATVAPDDDFGGWTSAAPVSSAGTATSNNNSNNKPVGFGGNDDLFSNVWE